MDNFWKDKKVLTTGGSGYKGSWLLLMLDKFGAQITDISLDPPSKPHMHELLSYQNVTHKTLDIKNYEKVKEVVNQVKPEIVLHLAARPVLLDSYTDPLGTYHTNVIGPLNILESSLKVGTVKALLNVTTDKVYHNRGALAYKEDDRLGGVDPYSNSKACSEMVTRAYRDSFYRKAGIGLSTARGGNVISGGDWQKHRLVPNLVRIINKDSADSYFYRNDKILIRRDSIRPWSYVLDILSGYLTLARRIYDDAEKYSGAYNFSSQYDSIRSVGEFADDFLQTYGVDSEEYIVPFNDKHEDKWHEDRILILDSIKSRIELGWRSYVGFEEMIKLTVNWYKAYYNNEDMDKYSKNELDNYMRKLDGKV